MVRKVGKSGSCSWFISRPPGILSGEMYPHWRFPTANYKITFCAKWDRAALLEDYREMVSRARGIRTITRLMVSDGILEQFNLYRYQYSR